MRTLLVCWGRLLLQQVVGDVHQLDRLAGHRQHLLGVVVQRNVAVGYNPAFRPEAIRRGVGELVGLALPYRSAVAVLVQLAGLALDGDVLAVADRHSVNSHVLLGGVGEVVFPLRPLRPVVALVNVPLLDDGTRLNRKVLKPRSVRGLRVHLVRYVKCR